MNNKLAIISGFLGASKNRYMVYQENVPLREKMERAKQVPGIEGLEICYPEDFGDYEETKALLKEFGFGISAINFRCRRTGSWTRGSFTSAKAHERAELVEDFKRCIDIAKELGVDKITTCPLNEGHDYIFEMDYDDAYTYFVETMREVATYAGDAIKICIEYKLNDPRGRCLIASAGEGIAFCQEVGLDNVGLTVDFGHSIQTHERPAQALVLAHRAKRLFHVHMNDNDKLFDWDMLPGAYNMWDFLEFIYYLQHKIHYTGWISYDVMPKEVNTVEHFQAVVNLTNKLFELSDRLDPEKIREITAERNPAKTTQYLYSIL